ncbi:MAG: hypothetical protein KA297_10830 [Kofleriaceae bacterium]|nr:hypothetical protein [Kofleriaceae bacterium]
MRSRMLIAGWFVAGLALMVGSAMALAGGCANRKDPQGSVSADNPRGHWRERRADGFRVSAPAQPRVESPETAEMAAAGRSRGITYGFHSTMTRAVLQVRVTRLPPDRAARGAEVLASLQAELADQAGVEALEATPLELERGRGLELRFTSVVGERRVATRMRAIFHAGAMYQAIGGGRTDYERKDVDAFVDSFRVD